MSSSMPRRQHPLRQPLRLVAIAGLFLTVLFISIDASPILLPPNNQTQELALATLEHMQDRLTTPFSNLTTVIEVGFPQTFQPCVLQKILDSKKEDNNDNPTTTTIHILVLGGSSAARPGNGCNNPPNDPYAGRFSNLLESQLNNDWQTLRYDSPELSNDNNSIHFQVTNMAQGAEVSAQGALFLDATVDRNHTDLIVWDYSINDSTRQGGPEEEVRKLDFWLHRLSLIYAGERPPPILLTYLWGHRAGNQLERGLIETLDKRPMTYIGDLVQAYVDKGWDIAVVNVGGAVDSQYLRNHIRLLFDDALHPGCRGTKFIADMLEYALLDNLATTCPTSESRNDEYDEIPSLPNHPETTTLWPNTETLFRELWVDLFHPKATIGSLSPWMPRVPGQSNLNLTFDSTGNGNGNRSWPLELVPMHTGSTREDKKYGYRLPPCNDNNHNDNHLLVGTLHDPHLKWLGLALRVAPRSTRLQINNLTVPLNDCCQVDRWDYGQQLLTHWIDMDPYTTQGHTTSFQLSFCHESSQWLRSSGERPNLQYLIGVSLPPLS